MQEAAEEKRLKLLRMRRGNSFLKRHLEFRKGVSSQWYELNIEDIIKEELSGDTEEMTVREMIMKYDPTFRKCFTRYSATGVGAVPGVTRAGYSRLCQECQVWCQINKSGLTKEGKPPRITEASTDELFDLVVRKKKEKEAEP